MSEQEITLTPELRESLLRYKNAQERLGYLERQLDALSEETELKQEEARKAYLDRNSKRFSDVDPLRALTGAPVSHAISVGELVTYRVRPPVGSTTHSVRNFLQNPGDLGPVSNEEGMLLGWLVEVQLHADEATPQDLAPLDMTTRLSLIRQLPAALVDRLADECLTLQTWLNVYLDQNMGNS